MTDQPKTWEYCAKCAGYGTITGYDSVPYGDTNVSMASEELCPECTEQGKCPRCGERFAESDEQCFDLIEAGMHCPHCNWNWGANKDDVDPAVLVEPDYLIELPDRQQYACDDWMEQAYEERTDPGDNFDTWEMC